MLFRKRGETRGPLLFGGLPLYAVILFAVALLAALIYLLAVLSPAFAAGFNSTVGAFFRTVMAHLTSWLPFSLAELLLFSSPAVTAFLCVLAYRKCKDWPRTLRFLGSFFSVISIFFSLFVFTFGTGHHTETLDRRLGISVGEISREELIYTAEQLALAVNEAAESVTFGEDGFSVMPYDLSALNDKLLAAYEPVSAAYPFIQSFDSRVKPVLASKLMSYTHITGVYSFFTGEANLNVHFPAYTLPYTAAHELAHQRGIARENEANFVAFLVTAASEDAYIRYAGYLNLYEYVAAALYRTDAEAYAAVAATLSPEVKDELRAYAAFFETFRDAPVADLSDAVNDAYLKLNGSTAGTASYGLVVELAVAYYRPQK
jgi:hypothetical protein